jgi:hypothetical protein
VPRAPSESAIPWRKKLLLLASVADQNFQITRDMAQVAESALAELAASPGNDGVVSSTAGDSVSIISLTPPVSTTLRASAPPTFTLETALHPSVLGSSHHGNLPGTVSGIAREIAPAIRIEPTAEQEFQLAEEHVA